MKLKSKQQLSDVKDKKNVLIFLLLRFSSDDACLLRRKNV